MVQRFFHTTGISVKFWKWNKNANSIHLFNSQCRVAAKINSLKGVPEVESAETSDRQCSAARQGENHNAAMRDLLRDLGVAEQSQMEGEIH